MALSLARSYRWCEALTRREAGNFYPAFRVLPAPQRRAMCALYAFMRIADDISDEPAPTEWKRDRLDQRRTGLHAALAGKYEHLALPALHHTVRTYRVPPKYLEAVIDGVAMDLEPVAYRTFDELYVYCYRVASAVGLACIHVWGFRGARATAYAESAGIAFQLTNILRDLGEDATRGRVYLPREDLERFGYDAGRLSQGVRDAAFRALMRFEVGRARQFYEAAWPLVPLLAPAGRAVFLMMARTYRGLLDEIERRDYDVFSGRVRIGKWRRLMLALRVLFRAVRLDGAVMGERVLIIGGGLAGLAAAAALAPRGFAVTLIESKARLGGRAGSFQDAATGQLIDACQHVSMGCCTNLAHLCRAVGVAHLMEPQPCLYFMTPDRRVSRFRSDRWPAPLHLLRSFASAHYLTATEKLRIGWGLMQLQRTAADADPPFQDWLTRHGQTPRTVDRFWGLVLVSALNETPDRIGLRYARKVFVDGFLTHPRGFEVEVPSVPLGRLYGDELRKWLDEHGVRLLLQAPARAIRMNDQRIASVELRQGETLDADWYISAVPFDRLLDLLPAAVIERHPYFAGLRHLETSPITSVHCWFDRPATDLPHIVLIDSVGQWVFNRGAQPDETTYLQVVVSAARQFRGLGREEVERRVVDELRRLLPRLADAKLMRAKVVTEHAATFSAVPGVDRWRPPQASPLPNLLVAGDWTATGWPATMEGAVRSGYRAAEALLMRLGRPERLVQPDLA